MKINKRVHPSLPNRICSNYYEQITHSPLPAKEKGYRAKCVAHLGCIICTLFLFSACNTTQYLQDDEAFYGGATIELENPKRVNQQNQITADLSTISRPTPNSKIFGQRTGVWAYYKYNKDKGLSKFLRKRLGEEPVFYNEEKSERSRLIMENYLHDKGYFNASISYDTTLQDKEVYVNYKVKSKGQYQIGQVHLSDDTTTIASMIRHNQQKTYLQKDKYYSVANLQAERFRLTELAQNLGYYNFSKDYLYYFVDTTAAGPLTTDIFMKIKAPADSSQHEVFYMGDVFVYPEYTLNTRRDFNWRDTIRTEQITVLQNETFIKAKTLERFIAQDSGDLYAKSKQELTVNHFLDLGVFKFVNLKYKLRQENGKNYLDRLLYLTPSLTQNISISAEASTATSYDLGSALTFNYSDRNLFKGAEQFSFNLSAGVETQQGGSFINTLDLTAQASLSFPRFITPFKIKNEVSYFVPKTRINLSDNFQRRTEFFTLNAFQIQFGYDWKETKYKRHEVYPINMSVINLLDQTPVFRDTILVNNPRLASSVQDGVILGLNYRYTYTDQEVNTLKNYWFFQIEIQTSGNLASLIFKPASVTEPGTIFNAPFYQFGWIETDARYNFLHKKSSLVARLNVGVGLPYGNSSTLPYVKQFFAGGSNSIRAFRIREVGPGAEPSNADDSNTFFDQTGDIKLEMNLEYRFDILPAFFLEGAVFADAGNVWLIKENEVQPDGLFDFNDFYKELAVGSGFGIRLDLTFLILRLDMAVPLRDPSLPDGNRWRFNQLSIPGDIKYNIAIGYPF